MGRKLDIPDNSRVYPLLRDGIHSQEDVTRLLEATMADVLEGTITPAQARKINSAVGKGIKIFGAICTGNAGRK